MDHLFFLLNPFDVYVEYIRHEVKNLHLLLK